jgi:hypothetical protein
VCVCVCVRARARGRACVASDWELLCRGMVCKSRGMIAKSNNGLVSVTVQGSINLVCNACSCRSIKLPSKSFLCPCCMVLRVLVFPLPGQIHVYCAWCAWRKLTKGYCFSYSGDVLYAYGYCSTVRNFSQAQVITPWWWIPCDPKHVGVIFNVSFRLVHNIDCNVYDCYNWVH